MSDIPHRPIIFARLAEREHLSGVISHETAEVAAHLTFTGIRPMREVMDAITRIEHALTDAERVFVGVPASWSLYVSPAVLKVLKDHGGYRIEGG